MIHAQFLVKTLTNSKFNVDIKRTLIILTYYVSYTSWNDRQFVAFPASCIQLASYSKGPLFLTVNKIQGVWHREHPLCKWSTRTENSTTLLPWNRSNVSKLFIYMYQWIAVDIAEVRIVVVFVAIAELFLNQPFLFLACIQFPFTSMFTCSYMYILSTSCWSSSHFRERNKR